jgi:hypothetical protein
LPRLNRRIAGAVESVDATLILNEMPVLVDQAAGQQAPRFVQRLKQTTALAIAHARRQGAGEMAQPDIEPPPFPIPSGDANDRG